LRLGSFWHCRAACDAVLQSLIITVLYSPAFEPAAPLLRWFLLGVLTCDFVADGFVQCTGAVRSFIFTESSFGGVSSGSLVAGAAVLWA